MRWLPVLVALGACGDSKLVPDASPGDAPLADAPVDANPNMPATLAETGLCVDAACTQIASGIHAYTPRHELWADSATKKRWIYLPPGTQIDTSDMDLWQFPVGTKLWKEFTRDGVRVETRLVMRVGPGDTQEDWFYVAYVWNQAQNATTAEPFGMPDANGTPHDVPSRALCRQCHENLAPSRVLGFAALQLDWDNPDEAQLDLAKLAAMDLLSHAPAPPQTSGDPYFPLPDCTATERAALGYMHANCGHCHNPTSMVYANHTPVNLRLTVGALGSLASTPTYTTAVDIDGDPIGGRLKIVKPGMPDQSILIYRFESTNPAEKMPAVGTEDLDTDGQALLRAWITNIP